MSTLDDFYRALRAHATLAIQGERWILGEHEFDATWIAKEWDEIALARAADATLAHHPLQVVFMDEGELEEVRFLDEFKGMQQLVLYGVTCIVSLDHLAGHPSLRRVAITNYSGLRGGESIAWLDQVPMLEELILFDRYLELYDTWSPDASMLSQLRSLWMVWDDFKELAPASFDSLELLTLQIVDIYELIALATSEEDRLEEEEMKAYFQRFASRPGFTCRLLIELAKHDKLAAQAREVLTRWLPEGCTVEFYWKKAHMPLLNGDHAFMEGALRT